MLLHDDGLARAIETGDLIVDPYDPKRLQPSSIDLTLGNQFRHFEGTPPWIDPREDNTELMALHTVNQDCHFSYFSLLPHEFVLAATVETVGLSDAMAGRVEGKSSLGRLGLMVHSTAGFIDPGFSGQITLELFNATNSTIRLYPGMPVAQICIFKMTGSARVPYNITGKYSGQTGPTPSRYHQNFA